MSKSNLYGFLGSALSCIILFIFMWFYVMPYTSVIAPVEEEGLMISFGNSDDAGGMGSSSEPLAAPKSETLAPVVSQKSTHTLPVKEQLITQNDNSNTINEQKQKIQERKEKQLIENQKIEADKAIALQKKKEQDAINKANATVNGLFANGSTTSGTGNGKGSGNGTGKGSGNGSGDGIQGNPVGHGNLGGNSWSLGGRLLTGQFVSPSYNKDVEGKVTVNIKVDSNGKVISSSIGSPTTISDAETRNAATTAANNTHFSSGKGISSGTITYNFKLK